MNEIARDQPALAYTRGIGPRPSDSPRVTSSSPCRRMWYISRSSCNFPFSGFLLTMGEEQIGQSRKEQGEGFPHRLAAAAQ
jgi:hypothetical protein